MAEQKIRNAYKNFMFKFSPFLNANKNVGNIDLVDDKSVSDFDPKRFNFYSQVMESIVNSNPEIVKKVFNIVNLFKYNNDKMDKEIQYIKRRITDKNRAYIAKLLGVEVAEEKPVVKKLDAATGPDDDDDAALESPTRSVIGTYPEQSLVQSQPPGAPTSPAVAPNTALETPTSPTRSDIGTYSEQSLQQDIREFQDYYDNMKLRQTEASRIIRILDNMKGNLNVNQEKFFKSGKTIVTQDEKLKIDRNISDAKIEKSKIDTEITKVTNKWNIFGKSTKAAEAAQKAAQRGGALINGGTPLLQHGYEFGVNMANVAKNTASAVARMDDDYLGVNWAAKGLASSASSVAADLATSASAATSNLTTYVKERYNVMKADGLQKAKAELEEEKKKLKLALKNVEESFEIINNKFNDTQEILKKVASRQPAVPERVPLPPQQSAAGGANYLNIDDDKLRAMLGGTTPEERQQYYDSQDVSPNIDKINLRDRGIFVALTFIIRAIALFITEWAIYSGFINTFSQSFNMYFGVYMCIFILVLILTNSNNEDITFFNQLFYYVNITSEDNKGLIRVMLQILCIFFILPIPYMVKDFRLKDKSPNRVLTYTDKSNIYYSVDKFTLFTWILTSIVALSV
jgi:hypothetical protein